MSTIRCRCGEQFTESEFARFDAHRCPYTEYENEHGESAPEGWASGVSEELTERLSLEE